MKKNILKIVVIGVLSVALTGCLSEEEKKAKDIVVKKIIKDKEREERFLEKLGKPDTRPSRYPETKEEK